jgi:hypothetical protein
MCFVRKILTHPFSRFQFPSTSRPLGHSFTAKKLARSHRLGVRDAPELESITFKAILISLILDNE